MKGNEFPPGNNFCGTYSREIYFFDFTPKTQNLTVLRTGENKFSKNFCPRKSISAYIVKCLFVSKYLVFS